MKTIIAGSREITDYQLIKQAVAASGFDITQVVSGGARGVDRLGERYAADSNIDCKVMPADWATHGKKAGYLRNTAMARYADALIAIWDGKSKGTGHMIDLAREHNLKVYVFKLEGK